MITLRRVHRWVYAHARRFRGRKMEVLRRRTAAQLLDTMDLSGCGDWGVLLSALLRAAGLPTIYVEAISTRWARRWEEGETISGYQGHVFLEVLVHGRWLLVDSTRGWYWRDYDPDEPVLPLGYYAFAKGLDAWDLGITSGRLLGESLENMAEYLAERKVKAVAYRLGFTIPNLLFVGSRRRSQELRRRWPRVRVRPARRSIPRGLDVLVVGSTWQEIRRRLAASGVGTIESPQGSQRAAFHRLPGGAGLCALRVSPDEPLPAGLLVVSDGKERALSRDSCLQAARVAPARGPARPGRIPAAASKGLSAARSAGGSMAQ